MCGQASLGDVMRVWRLSDDMGVEALRCGCALLTIVLPSLYPSELQPVPPFPWLWCILLEV